MIKIVFSIIILLGIQSIFAQDGVIPQAVIGVDEKLGDNLPEGIRLIDEQGDTTLLEDYIDKPTILTLVYYRCPGICTPLMEGVSVAIDRTDLELGEDYQVLTISFDPTETTELAVNKKRNHLTLMTSDKAQEHWKFFTSDSSSIIRLTDAVGFRYKRTGNDYIHSATLVVVSPQGKITRYLNGTYFLPFEVKMAVLEASEGKVGPTINKILQYCYSYDPTGQTYVLNITKVAGILIVFFSVLLLMILSIKPITRRIRNATR